MEITEPRLLSKKIKHNYTSELELKSLLIRIKNKRNDVGTTRHNTTINKYVKWHTALNNKRYTDPTSKGRRNAIKSTLKMKVVQLSECTQSNNNSYERFGEIILLMIKNILKKSHFSGYTYKDDFYSDAVYKIIKYLHNFNHKLISIRTGTSVNAFAYISQIIHHSVIYIIKTKKKDNNRLRSYITQNQATNTAETGDIGWGVDTLVQGHSVGTRTRIIALASVDPLTLVATVLAAVESDKLNDSTLEGVPVKFEVSFPNTYDVSFSEIEELKGLSRQNIHATRAAESSL